jgi:hypothetical protein
LQSIRSKRYSVSGIPPVECNSAVDVDCYCGRKPDERPVRFRIDGHEYIVRDVVDEWYGPHDAFYKVRADDGNLYVLQHEAATPDGIWRLVSYRQSLPETLKRSGR